MKVDFKNVNSFLAAIISNGKATLHELKTIYTVEDAYIMWEIIAVCKYNEFVAIENSKKARA